MVDAIIVKEAWYKSRRLWGSALTLLVVGAQVFLPNTQYDSIIESVSLLVASGLGIASWTYPKK